VTALISFGIGLPEFIGSWTGLDADQAKLVQTRFRTMNDTARFRLARRSAWEAVYPRRESEHVLLADIADTWARIDAIIREKPHLAPTREAVQAATTGFVVGKRLLGTRQSELLRPFRGMF
jgi:hypothetical protein